MSYDYSYVAAGEALSSFLSLGLNFLFSSGLAIVGYVLRSLAIYAIAKRRGLRHPWMAWVPVVDLWLLGCISDQYQYVVKGQNKSRRKILLTLEIITCVLTVAVAVLGLSSVAALFKAIASGAHDSQIISSVVNLLLSTMGIGLPLGILAIVLTVFRCIALYDLYASCVPQNATLFLVVGILFKVTEPFFLFFSRNKDEGMPPRRPEPQTYYQEDYSYQQPQQPWNQGE